MSTRLGVGRPAGKELAPLQQAPEKLHVETWAGRKQGPGLRISQEVEIVPGCAVTLSGPSCPFGTPVSPGPGRIIRNMLGWSMEEKTVGSGVWLFRGALQGENLFSSLSAAGDWVKRGRATQVGGPLGFLVFLLVRVRAWPSCRSAYWCAVLATASWYVEGYRTPDEALVC